MAPENSPANPFDEVPEWYKSEQPQGGSNAATQTGPQAGAATAQQPKQNGTQLAFLTLMALLAIGGVGLLYMVFIGSSNDTSEPPAELAFADSDMNTELEAGDCFHGVIMNGAGVLRFAEAECDGDAWGRIPASYVADEGLPFPAFDQEFWRSAFVHCNSFIRDESIPMPILAANDGNEWSAGERRVLCGAVYEEKQDEVVAEVNAIEDELDDLAEALGIPQ